MARQFRDKSGKLWIASYFGSQPIGGARVGSLPIEAGAFDLDSIEMEEHGTDRRVLATLPRGVWQQATDDQLREALEQALVPYDD